jgi:hypothetical protein
MPNGITEMHNSTLVQADKPKNSLREILIIVFFYIFVISFLYRVQLASGFNILTSDRFDGIIENSLLEHWYNVFRGKSSWNTVGYFFPYSNTMGYNDSYFLYGVISSIFRYLGIDLFLSADLVNICLKTIGYFSFYTLCRRCIGIRPFFSVTGSVIFSLGNNLIIQSGHAQLISVAFSPLLAIFLYRYITFLYSGKNKIKTILFGCLSGLLIGS